MRHQEQMIAAGYKKVVIRHYFVDALPNYKVWGKNKKECYAAHPELKGRKLVYNRSETTWIQTS